MRLSQKRNQGFTLIEIIIVVVILGILAAIALPKITGNIDRARAAEAFQTSSLVAGAFQRCVDEHTGGLRTAATADVNNCAAWGAGINALNITDPSAVSNNFTYTFTAAAGAATAITMTAQGKFNNNVAADKITFTYDGAGGGQTKACTGIFTSMCKN